MINLLEDRQLEMPLNVQNYMHAMMDIKIYVVDGSYHVGADDLRTLVYQRNLIEEPRALADIPTLNRSTEKGWKHFAYERGLAMKRALMELSIRQRSFYKDDKFQEKLEELNSVILKEYMQMHVDRGYPIDPALEKTLLQNRHDGIPSRSRTKFTVHLLS